MVIGSIDVMFQRAQVHHCCLQILRVDYHLGSVFYYLIHVCVGWLSDCVYIIVTFVNKRNLIVDLSDLTLDQAHLIL